MIIGPKYKIARRLGAPVFEKTQTQKFALSQTQGGKGGKKPAGRGAKSDFAIQMLEKQKARYSYALTEKQFSKYVLQALQKKGNNQELLFATLETRLDNVVLRSGFTLTRLAARQMTSHGHITINGRRVTIPSYQVKLGDKIAIREGSQKKPLFQNVDETLKKAQVPSWIKVDLEKRTAEVQGAPKLVTSELLFDIGQVLEFYSR
jgi:small subunit ribosomal protein S4